MCAPSEHFDPQDGKSYYCPLRAWNLPRARVRSAATMAAPPPCYRCEDGGQTAGCEPSVVASPPSYCCEGGGQTALSKLAVVQPCNVLHFVAAYQPALRVTLLPTCRATFHTLLAEELPRLALTSHAGSVWVSSRRSRHRRVSLDWLSWSARRFKATQETAIACVTEGDG